MKGKRAISDYLEDALDAAEKAAHFVQDVDYASFASNDEKAFAVVRALEIIGEAARHIPESFRSSYPNIPWEDMAGMRDVLIHGYFGVNLEVVWKTVHEDLPSLRLALGKVLADLDDHEDDI